jgi:hypothetical protein
MRRDSRSICDAFETFISRFAGRPGVSRDFIWSNLCEYVTDKLRGRSGSAVRKVLESGGNLAKLEGWRKELRRSCGNHGLKFYR